MQDAVDLDNCEWRLSVQRSRVAAVASRPVRADTARRFVRVPRNLPKVIASCLVVFDALPRGMWRPALEFVVLERWRTAHPGFIQIDAEPSAEGGIAATDDWGRAVSPAEQVFADRAAGLTQDERAALVSRAAFRFGQGEASGEIDRITGPGSARVTMFSGGPWGAARAAADEERALNPDDGTELDDLEALRAGWADANASVTFEVRSQPLDGANVLNQGIGDLPTAQRRAREFNYDYSGLHIIGAEAGRVFAVCATGFRDVPLAGADSNSEMLAGGRRWPPPILG